MKPEKNILTKGHIKGWIDIVGFKNRTCRGSKCYVNGNVTDSLLIQHGQSHTIKGLQWWNYGIESLTSDITSVKKQGCIESTLTVNLVYYHAKLICNPICHIRKKYFYETQTFTDTETNIPQMFVHSTMDASVEIHIYNNSVNPKTIIIIPDPAPDTIKITYTYGNETITHYFGIGTIEYTEKNVPYMNITENNFWEGGLGDDGNLTRINDDVVLNSANFNPGNLSIEISDPYNTQKLDNFNITTVEWHGAKDTINPIFYLVVGIMVILLCGTYFVIRSMRYG